jgi:hypothetical protein
VVQLTFGPSTRKCTRVAGSFGDYDDCETRIPVSGRVRELADGRDITLKGAAIDKNGFVIYAAPVTNDGGEASTVVGCATVGYEFWGAKASPDIEGDLTVICYSKLIAGRTLISADEILWQRSEHARLVRR